MQDKICNDVSFCQTDIFFRQNFASIRVDTALFLKKANKSRHGHSEITLEEIYRLIANNFRLSETLSEKLVNLELETEYRNAVPIYENIEKVRKLLKEKAQVILVSDMYLTAEQIRKILLQFDDIFNDIPIFVSGELKRMRKSRGSISAMMLPCWYRLPAYTSKRSMGPPTRKDNSEVRKGRAIKENSLSP